MHFQDQKLLVEGSLSPLRLDNLQIPRRKFRDQRQKLFENNVVPVFSDDQDDPYGEQEATLNITPAVDSPFDKRYGDAEQNGMTFNDFNICGKTQD